jgi:hypothetical protein
LALLAVTVGALVVAGTSPAVDVGVDELSVQGIVDNVNETVPQLSFDGVGTGNESSRRTTTPGISPLPTVPVDDDSAEETPGSVFRGIGQSA